MSRGGLWLGVQVREGGACSFSRGLGKAAFQFIARNSLHYETEEEV